MTSDDTPARPEAAPATSAEALHAARGVALAGGVHRDDAVVPAFLVIVLGGVGTFRGAVLAALAVGLVVGLTGACASEWSLMSMYLLFIAVVTFRARGFAGKKSALDA